MLLSYAVFFFKINFLQQFFRITMRLSNSLDQDQDRYFVGPDLEPKCFQRLSADNKRHPKQGKSTYFKSIYLANLKVKKMFE